MPQKCQKYKPTQTFNNFQACEEKKTPTLNYLLTIVSRGVTLIVLDVFVVFAWNRIFSKTLVTLSSNLQFVIETHNILFGTYFTANDNNFTK